MNGQTAVMPRPGFVFRRTPRRIFFIGFNKTATSSLALMMMASGILTIHSSGNGKLFGRPASEQQQIPHATRHMLANLETGRPALTGLENYDAFMDLTVGPIDLCLRFRNLFNSDPTALFVLNTRPVDDWIRSRRNHRKMLRSAAEHFNLKRPQVIRKWRSDFLIHHTDARAFFEQNAPEQFLEWDIATPPDALCDFFGRHDIDVNPDYYFKVRETGGLFLPEPLRAVPVTTDVPIQDHTL